MAQDQVSLDCLSHVDEANEILKRLTVQNLCLMSNVSGTWKNLIDDADFKALHLAWSKKNPLMLVVTPRPLNFQDSFLSDDEYSSLYEEWVVVDEDDIHSLVLTSLNPTNGDVIYRQEIDTSAEFEVLSSGRGCLFLVHSWVNFIVFNATTKRIQNLPEADPPYSNAVGFGYIESENAYAIVNLCYGSCQILMLTETGEMLAPWKTIKEECPLDVSGNAGVFVKNTCFWMDGQQFYPRSANSILGLEIDSEKFYRIDYPNPKCYENGHDVHMGELNNELFLTDNCLKTLKMDIWLRENGENAEWEIKYRIDLSSTDGLDAELLTLIGYVDGDQDEDQVLIFQDYELYDQVLYYEVKARKFKIGKQLHVEDDPGNIMFPYSERFNSIRRPEAR